jgi:hypothetical protein
MMIVVFHYVFWITMMLVSFNTAKTCDPRNQLQSYTICKNTFRIISLPNRYDIFKDDKSAVFVFTPGCKDSLVKAANEANLYIYRREATVDNYFGRVDVHHDIRDRVNFYYRGDPSYKSARIGFGYFVFFTAIIMLFCPHITVMWYEIILMKMGKAV